MFLNKLDVRYERARKPGPGVSANARRERIEGQPSTSQPPVGLPSWMLDQDYHQVYINELLRVLRVHYLHRLLVYLYH